MNGFSVPSEAMTALNAFLIKREGKVEAEMRDKLIELAGNGSSVVGVVALSELAFAKKDELPPKLLLIAAQSAMLCDTFNFSDMKSNGRGAGIAAALMAMPGVGELVQPAADLPELAPLPQFTPEPVTAPSDDATAPTT